MSIDYTKSSDEEHIRYFLELPVIGWYETDQGTYQEVARKAMKPGAWERSVEPDAFNGTGINGYRVTARNGKKPPQSYKTMNLPDAETEPEASFLPPRVEGSSHSVTLTFPEGSYTDYQDVDGALVVVLSTAEYEALAKAQTPMSLERIAGKIAGKPVPEDSIRAAVRDGAVEALQGIAKDLREGKTIESPFKGATTKLRAVKDLLK